MSRTRLLLVCAAVSLSAMGCSTLGARKLNERFPRVSVLDKRLQAVTETQQSFDRIEHANLYAYVRSEHVSEALRHALTEKPLGDPAGEYEVRLIKPWITIGNADIRLSTDFEARWLDVDTKRSKVTVVGSLAVHGVPAIVATPEGGFSVGVRIAGENVHIGSLFAERELGWWWWFLERKAALEIGSKIVNWAMERINGQIQDAGAPLKLDPIQLLAKEVPSENDSIINITDGNPIALKLRIEPTAAAVDSRGIYVIGQLGTYRDDPPKPQPLPPVEIPNISRKEKEQLLLERNMTLRNNILTAANTFAAPLPTTTSAAFTKESLASVINSTLSVVDRCANVHYKPPQERKDFEIPMPKIDLACSHLDKIDCSTDERCFGYFTRLAENNKNMDCDYEEEYTWEDAKDAACCLCCGLVKPDCCTKIAHKAVRTVTDLVCEGTKGVANGFLQGQKTIAELAEHVGQKQLLDKVCRAQSFSDRLFCEAAKGIAGAACEGIQTALNNAWQAGQNIGDTGLIGWKIGDGDAGIEVEADGRACLAGLSVAKDLNAFTINGSLAGRADVKYAWLFFKPTAYGTAITGCTEVKIDAKDFSVILHEAPNAYQGTIALDQCTDPDSGSGVPCLQLRLAEVHFKLKVDPEPVETIISQNWDDLGVRCSWPTLVGMPPIPIALTAAWVLNHYQDVKQLWGDDRQYFYLNHKYAPEVQPLLLKQKVTRWDKREQLVTIDWRPGVVVAIAE